MKVLQRRVRFYYYCYEYVLETYNPGGEDLDLLNALIANCH
jgi:hypothetical protein